MATIKIGEKEYTLLLSTKATKEVAKRYGGLENLGDKLLKAENFEMAINEVIWLIVLLANQSILKNNKLYGDTEALLDEETVELLTTPYDLSASKEAIMDALNEGLERNVHSEPVKNKVAE